MQYTILTYVDLRKQVMLHENLLDLRKFRVLLEIRLEYSLVLRFNCRPFPDKPQQRTRARTKLFDTGS